MLWSGLIWSMCHRIYCILYIGYPVYKLGAKSIWFSTWEQGQDTFTMLANRDFIFSHRPVWGKQSAAILWFLKRAECLQIVSRWTQAVCLQHPALISAQIEKFIITKRCIYTQTHLCSFLSSNLSAWCWSLMTSLHGLAPSPLLNTGLHLLISL